MNKLILMFVASVLTASQSGRADGTSDFTPTNPSFNPQTITFDVVTPDSTPAVILALAQVPGTPAAIPDAPTTAPFAPSTPGFSPATPNFTPTPPAASPIPVNAAELEANAALMAGYFPAFLNTDIQKRSSFVPSNTARLDKWKEVYTADYAAVAHVNLPAGLKIVSEVRAPKTDAEYTNYTQELDYFVSSGYTAVLLAWYLEDDFHGFDRVITYAKSKNLKVLFAYGGSCSATQTRDLYDIDPADYKAGLEYLSAKSDGFLVGWSHTRPGTAFKPDAKWVAFTVTSVRGANAGIPLVGELNYFNSDPKGDIFKNIPENVSGVMAFNFGVSTVNVDFAMSKILKPLNQPLLIHVVGERYFYATLRPNHKSMVENRAICKKIEDKYLKAGAAGTLTEAGDYSDTEVKGNEKGTSNLCKTTWSKP